MRSVVGDVGREDPARAGYTLMFGATIAATPDHQQGVASTVASTTQQVGGAVGLAVLVAIPTPPPRA